MKRIVTQVSMMGMIAGILSPAAWAVPAVFTMEVVEINGSTVGLPSTSVLVSPGDTVMVDVSLEGWTPESVATYQFAFDPASRASGGGSPLDLTPVSCAANADCPNSGSCDLGMGVCVCSESIFVDQDRVDWIFSSPLLVPISAGSCVGDLRAVGSVLIGGAVADNGALKYLGSAVFTVPDDACGQYTLAFSTAATDALLSNGIGQPIAFTADASVILSVDAACPADCMVIASVFPPNCEVDARQPHPLNDASTPLGFTSFEVTFSDACDPANLGVSDFSISESPFTINPPPPQIIAVTPIASDAVRVDVSIPFHTKKWTCIVLASDPNQKSCFGYLPGDVNGDLTAGPSDILAVIDSLNNVIPRPVFATDADRGGLAGPEDILRVIDMLNGASQLAIWLDETLPACPTAP